MNRLVSGALATLVLALGTLFAGPVTPATAQPPAVAAPGDPACSLEEWQKYPLQTCIDRLQDVASARVQCLEAPTPEAPDNGMAGWFISKPTWDQRGIGRDLYSRYGYAGYDYTTYDIGCAQTVMHPDYKFENTVANGEFMLAGGIIGGSNALRERAWDPGQMWGWADPLVENATQAIYSKVFSVFGVLTLAVVGLYLIWRSRNAQLSGAMTTAGWALFVMVAVTAIAAWPIRSAHVADTALTSTLGVVHDAVGPSSAKIPPDCASLDTVDCRDNRPPAVRSSDTAVRTLLYRNWLRGLLGSADSETAEKYGPALYDSKSLTWGDVQAIQQEPDPIKRAQDRDTLLRKKQQNWMKVAEQIRTEDPDAYQYLQGTKGMERIGAGFVAILSAISFALFDIVASVLVLLGFLIFRWAVIAAPALGTVGLLRPASAGLRRLAGAVLAAVFNIAIFGTGAAVYLSAVDLIMSTPSLPGWLQVTLMLLCGVVAWILLRPYRRITQLGGNTPANGWARALVRPAAATAAATVAGGAAAGAAAAIAGRPETRPDAPNEAKPAPTETLQRELVRSEALPEQRRWVTPGLPEAAPSQAIYRPEPVRESAPEPSSSQPVVRAEAR
ncbi:MFS transporter [Hamadaea tsunoensis]|uniref:MFS transporter n=1 Tax=Hamadaea tsunoensis TaxID=53368 RepID=UPI0003F5B696|nr:MFS transporter [Hamadaea tsunoensis]